MRLVIASLVGSRTNQGIRSPSLAAQFTPGSRTTLFRARGPGVRRCGSRKVASR